MSKATGKPINFSFLVDRWTPHGVTRALAKVLDAHGGVAQVQFFLFDNYRDRLEGVLAKIGQAGKGTLTYRPATRSGTFQPQGCAQRLRFHFDFQPYPPERMRQWKRTLAAPVSPRLKELSRRANQESKPTSTRLSSSHVAP